MLPDLLPIAYWGGIAHLFATLAVALSIICFVGFAWAIRGHFQQHEKMPLGMRVVSMLSLAGFGWFLIPQVRAVPMDNSQWLYPDVVSCVLFIVSLVVFWLSIGATRARPLTLAFAADVPTFLQHRGPYQYVRHPFYLSYLLFWLGTAIASRSALHWIVPAIMVPLYVEAARREERKFTGSSLASAYNHYREHTGMLLPGRNFSWARFTGRK